MKYPLNIGAEAPITMPLAAVLHDPLRHLAIAVKPDLAFGRLKSPGAGQAHTAAPILILPMKGRIELSVTGTTLELSADRMAARINAGCDLSWKAGPDCELIVITDPGLAGEEPLSPIDLNSAMGASASPSAAVLLSAAPLCTSTVLHEAPGLTLGLWSATPYARRGIEMAVSEVMYLQEGRVTLAAPDGTRFDFAAGDVLLAPEGAELAWDNPEPVQKLFLSASI